MTRCVLDASTAVEILLGTEVGQQALTIVDEDTPCAPHLFDVEVLSVIRRLTYKRELTLARANMAIEDLAMWPLMRFEHTALLSGMWGLRNNVSAYDAAYAALAISLNLPLLTADNPLAGAEIPGLRLLLVST
ncbi:MAG: type II toxin-antitoxin system VapC family toxin [Myxococcota bacterium]